jgi:hypothetical protein
MVRGRERRDVRQAQAVSVALAIILLIGPAAQGQAAELPGALRSQVQALVRDADADGLPSDRLLVKAQEGVAKGVPVERILIVLSTMSAKMSDAARLLDGVSPRRLEPKIRRVLIGDLLAAEQLGVDRETLQELAKIGLVTRKDPKALHGAVVAVTDLAASEAKGPEAQELVKLALTQTFTEAEFPKLVGTLTDLARQVGINEAVSTLGAIVASGQRPDWAVVGGMDPGRGPPPGVGKKGQGTTKPTRDKAGGKP